MVLPCWEWIDAWWLLLQHPGCHRCDRQHPQQRGCGDTADGVEQRRCETAAVAGVGVGVGQTQTQLVQGGMQRDFEALTGPGDGRLVVGGGDEVFGGRQQRIKDGAMPPSVMLRSDGDGDGNGFQRDRERVRVMIEEERRWREKKGEDLPGYVV